MTTNAKTAGYPPAEVTTILRIEGLVVLAGAVTAFAVLGGNWWLFALLILAPDLAMLGMLRSPAFGARLYNAVHTYAVPAVIGAVAWFAGAGWLLPYVAIWFAHIGMDRAVGYGLRYPGAYHLTHLGPKGKVQQATSLAHAG